jgi:hypothetical protein
MSGLTRRRFLILPLIVSVWSSLGRRLVLAGEASTLVNMYAKLDTRVGLRIANLGEGYLQQRPTEASLARLAKLVGGCERGSLRHALHRGELAMRAALQDRYTSDFETKRIVCVDGWVLSVTEARLHAWRHLNRGEGTATR